MEMDEETEYELLRQRNIEENLRMLASLGLEKGTAENALLPVAASGRVKPKPAKRRFSAEEDRPTPVRSSRRLQGLEPILVARKRAGSEADALLSSADPERRKTVRRGPIEMKSTFLSPEEQVAFMKTFRSASAARRSGQVLPSADDFRASVSALTIPSWGYIQKVTKDRIYSLAWHPYVSSDGRAIVCVGDKWGQLGLYALPVPGWTASDHSFDSEPRPGRTSDDEKEIKEDTAGAPQKPKRIAKRRNRIAQQPQKEQEEENKDIERAQEKEEEEPEITIESVAPKEEDEEDRQTVSVYQPHSRVISGIAFSPVNFNKLYTSSFDGTLRCMDAEKNAFDIVYTDDEGDSKEVLLTRVDVTGTGNELYFVNSAGQMKMRDLRASEKKKVETYQLHEKKAYCVHINKADEDMIATSSGDGTVCVWDVRMLDEEGSEALRTFRHSQSIASAFFSPLTGKKILSTSYDNTLRVWNYEEERQKKTRKRSKTEDDKIIDPLCSISHNNQTGRWLTPFQATWHPCSEDIVVIGDMKRAVDIIGINTEPEWWVRLEDEKMGTIPSLNAFHPTLYPKSLLASANASGRVFIWSDPVQV